MKTLAIRPTQPNPTSPDPDPVTNPQNPRPRTARWVYAAAGLAIGCALAVVGLVLSFGIGVLGIAGTR